MITSYPGWENLCKIQLTIPLCRTACEELSKLHQLSVWNHSWRPAVRLCQLLTLLPNGKGLSSFLNYGYERNMLLFVFFPPNKASLLTKNKNKNRGLLGGRKNNTENSFPFLKHLNISSSSRKMFNIIKRCLNVIKIVHYYFLNINLIKGIYRYFDHLIK